MGAIRQPIPSEDRHLVALDGIALPHIDLSLDNTVESNPGASTGAALLAADPGHRRPGEAEGRGRARLIGCGRRPFAEDSGIPVGIPGADEAERRIVFLVAPSGRNV